MDTQMIIRIDDDLKSKAAQIARSEGRSLSEVVRSFLEKYILEKDVTSAFDAIWDRARKRMESKGFTEKDVARVIREVRQKKK